MAGDYRSPILIMVGILAIGFVANLLITPVSDRFHEEGTVTDAADGGHRARVDRGVGHPDHRGRARRRAVPSGPHPS